MVLGVGGDHPLLEFRDQLIAFGALDADKIDDLAGIEIQGFAAGFRVHPDDRVIDRLPILVLRVEEARLAAPPAIGEGADDAVEPVFEALRQGVIGGVGIGEHRVAAAARHRQRVELRRLERRLVVGAVGVPALGAAAVDLVAQFAVGVEFVDAEEGDLRVLGVAGRFRRVRGHRAEALAVADEIRDRQILAAHAHDVVVEPSLIDPAESVVVHRLDVDAAHLDPDLRPQ